MDKEDLEKLMKMEQQIKCVFIKKRKIEEDKQKRLKEIQEKARLKVKMNEQIQIEKQKKQAERLMEEQKRNEE